MARGIIIFGASGSGTTTSGKALSKELNFTHIDTDDYFWCWDTEVPFTVPRPKSERIEKLEQDLAKTGKFVMSGSICGWDTAFTSMFDLAVFLRTPTEVRIPRLRAREYEEFGDRILEGGDMYEGHNEFVEWAATYDAGGLDGRSLALHQAWAKELPCKVIEADGTMPVEEIVRYIADEYRRLPIGKCFDVCIDRALGTAHPKYPEMIYLVNYGYVPNVIGGDGEEQDVYVLGIDRPLKSFMGKVIAVIHRLDDVEDKWVMAGDGEVYTKDEIIQLTHFQERFFKIEVLI